MKRTLWRHIAAIVVSLGPIAFAQTWESGPALPTGGEPREFAFGLYFDGSIYVIGGSPWVNGGDMDGSVHALSLATMTWSTPTPLEGMGPVIDQGGGVDMLGRMIVFGGTNLDNGDPGENRVYDPIEGPNTSIADRGAGAPDTYFAFCTDAEGFLYSLGGGPGPEATSQNRNSDYVERYDALADTWDPLAPMPMDVADAAAVHDGLGHILVLGGINSDGSSRLSTVFQYDIALNEWSDTAMPELPVAVSGLRAVLGADGRIYAMGGETGAVGSGTIVADVHVLDLGDIEWTAGPTMVEPRARFAVALGDDDFVYAMGGSNDVGGTDGCERLYTVPCPSFVAPPVAMNVWRGQTVGFWVDAVGGGTLQYQWRLDGIDLEDGPAPGGGTISGANTSALLITAVDAPDEGAYDVVVTNSCGSSISPSAALTVRQPPALPTQWSVTNLHPSWALRSEATGVSEGTQVGIAGMDVDIYEDLDQPVLWQGTADSAINLTPADSVGGACNAAGGAFQVGWWWWPYPCQIGGEWYTCYSQQAASWMGSAETYDNLQVSGYEYSYASDTDGVVHVGQASYDDASGNYYFRAVVWEPPSYYGWIIHPASMSNSALTAIADGRQFGHALTPYPGPKTHAGMWAGSADSFVDMHPAGVDYSIINGAGDDQAVGNVGYSAESEATLWSYAAGTDVSLHPAGASTSAAVDCAGGLQVGYAVIGGIGHAVVWSGSADGYVDLHLFVPAGILSSTAEGIEVVSDQGIIIVGSGFNVITGRTEALMWISSDAVPCEGDANGDGTVDPLDAGFVLARFGCSVGSGDEDCDVADANSDGAVDPLDVGFVLARFGDCP